MVKLGSLIALGIFSLALATPVSGRGLSNSLALSQGTAEAGKCVITPRDLAELQSLAGTPSAGLVTPAPFPIPIQAPVGDPVDEETLASIEATWRELAACEDANDEARYAALFTDDFYRRSMLAASASPPAGLIDYLQEIPATPQGAGTPMNLDAPATLHDARLLSDGRVGAVVIDPLTASMPFDMFFIFARVGERWLVDEAIFIERGE